MTTRPAAPLLRHLRHVALLGTDDAPTDARLLEDYLLRADGDAFAALVRRHGPMVRGVCRRILRDEHDADDAFQATFLVLVHKAASVSPRSAVANWLYGVAYRTAQKARTAAARRRARERQAGVIERRDEAAAEGREMWSLLDRELNRLPEKYRAVVVVCDLEGKTRKEAARQLGWPEGTVAGRLVRARALLARRLRRQGISAPVAALAAIVAGGATLKAREFLPADGASDGARGLARAVVRSMGVAKFRAAVVVTIAAIGAATLTQATVALGEPPSKEAQIALVTEPAWPPVPTAEQLVRYLNDSSEGLRSLNCTGAYLEFAHRKGNVGIQASFACRESGKFRLRGTLAGHVALDVGSNEREWWYWTRQGGESEVHRFPVRGVKAENTVWPLPIRPDWLPEAMGQAKLDPATSREVIARKDAYELVEKTETAQGQPAFKVTVFRRAVSAVQVPERLIRDPRGRVLCRATISCLIPAGTTGKTLPGAVEFDFPGLRATMRVQLNAETIRTSEAEDNPAGPIFQPPADKGSPP
jgi:RNA polymerase sigma factor (sigma-70 family)